jgi:3-oxoacyl-[acyl-carrier protein] reductase
MSSIDSIKLNDSINRSFDPRFSNIMDLELTAKVVLITGASRGICRAIARLFNDEGCRLALVGRRKHLLKEAAEELANSSGRTPLVLAEDITAPDAPDRIRSAVLASFGRLDILINNAGGSRPIENGFGSPLEWEEAMRLNFDAGRNLAHAFVGAMQAQKFGRIINITGTEEPIALNAAMPPNGATDIWSKALSWTRARWYNDLRQKIQFPIYPYMVYV